MGLQATFQSASAAIMSAFGDVAYSNIAYHSLGTFSYNTTTGGMTESGDVDTTIKTIFDETKSEEIQGRDILMTDQKLLVANLDISVTPKVGDYVTIDSKRWNVIDFIVDPALALYEIFVRKT